MQAAAHHELLEGRVNRVEDRHREPDGGRPLPERRRVHRSIGLEQGVPRVQSRVQHEPLDPDDQHAEDEGRHQRLRHRAPPPGERQPVEVYREAEPPDHVQHGGGEHEHQRDRHERVRRRLARVAGHHAQREGVDAQAEDDERDEPRHRDLEVEQPDGHVVCEPEPDSDGARELAQQLGAAARAGDLPRREGVERGRTHRPHGRGTGLVVQQRELPDARPRTEPGDLVERAPPVSLEDLNFALLHDEHVAPGLALPHHEIAHPDLDLPDDRRQRSQLGVGERLEQRRSTEDREAVRRERLLVPTLLGRRLATV